MEKIAAFCRRWQITELALFGSALRDDFGPESDVDLLATFAPDAPWSLFDLVTMDDELKEILGRDVDLIERKSVEQSHNWIRRQEILGTAERIYAAA
ncbi:MAG: nucleotidyltransferase family protein [Thermomicrobiales bacterium]